MFSDEVAPIGWCDRKVAQLEFGTKGANLASLPRAWTAPFALIPQKIAEEVKQTGRLFRMPADLLQKFERLSSTGKLIVRSSVVDESIWDRGTYESVVIECEASNLQRKMSAAIKKVVNSTGNLRTAAIVQRYIDGEIRGEFGNLIRVSKTRDQWELSSISSNLLPHRQRLNSQRDEAPSETRQLLIRAGQLPLRLFGSIGAWLNNVHLGTDSSRLTLEWVIKEGKLFLVQLDEEDEDLTGTNPFQIRIPRTKPPPPQDGTYLKSADQKAIAKWDKLKVLDDLWEAGSRHKPTLFYCPFERLNDSTDKTQRAGLRKEFADFVGPNGIVVRTSGLAEREKVPNLPRTEGLTPSKAVNWCYKHVDALARAGHDIKQFSFVIHRFMAARASAWVRADHQNQMVEIHSLWGLPDALQSCPYDIWEVHIPTETTTDYPEYKSDMLIPIEDGSWVHKRVKNELARNNCITRAQALDLANRSFRISERLGRACHIMWFVGCIDHEDDEFNIPWYWTEAHPTAPNPDRSNYRVFEIYDRSSLSEFSKSEKSRNRVALALKPNDLSLMRDNDFLKALARMASDANVPIILSGSTLAHAYYQLTRGGATVVATSEKNHLRKRKVSNFGKLIRDKIPEKIAKRQEQELTQQVPPSVKLGYLIGKLVEEAIEVRESKNREAKIGEMADLFEIIRTIAQNENIDFREISTAADKKIEQAGGFKKGLVLLQTSIPARGAIALPTEGQALDVLATKTDASTVEIPFSMFGFMKLDRPHAITFEELGVTLLIRLINDRIEVEVVRGREQFDLPLDETKLSPE